MSIPIPIIINLTGRDLDKQGINVDYANVTYEEPNCFVKTVFERAFYNQCDDPRVNVDAAAQAAIDAINFMVSEVFIDDAGSRMLNDDEPFEHVVNLVNRHCRPTTIIFDSSKVTNPYMVRAFGDKLLNTKPYRLVDTKFTCVGNNELDHLALITQHAINDIEKPYFEYTDIPDSERTEGKLIERVDTLLHEWRNKPEPRPYITIKEELTNFVFDELRKQLEREDNPKLREALESACSKPTHAKTWIDGTTLNILLNHDVENTCHLIDISLRSGDVFGNTSYTFMPIDGTAGEGRFIMYVSDFTTLNSLTNEMMKHPDYEDTNDEELCTSVINCLYKGRLLEVRNRKEINHGHE